jgi:cytochrome c biogenesis protein ResB
VARVLERAQESERIWNGGKEVRNPAIHVRVSDGKDEETLWVAQAAPRQLELGERRVTIDYDFMRHELGFNVMLEDFREITYPGIAMAQSYESDVVVSAPERQFPRKISMNNPLKFHGYKIFQSSFQRGERETSIFSVARDPGVPVVYTGFLILVLGLILIFFVKPYLIRWSAERRITRPEGAEAAVAAESSLRPVAVPSMGGGEARAD